MVRTIALVSLLLVAAVTPLPPATPTIQPESTKSAIITAAPGLPGSGAGTDAYHYKAWSYWDAISPSTWGTWALAIFALIAARIALRTLSEINTQSRIAELTASAAKKNADVAERNLVDLERPWIVIEPLKLNGLENDPPAFPLMLTADFQLRNCGRSIAFVTKAVGKLAVIPNPLPDEPIYAPPPSIGDSPMPPQKRIKNAYGAMLSAAELQSVRKGDASLMLYGIIEYRDISGSHETRFGLKYEFATMWIPGRTPRGWFVYTGPVAWNRYT